MQKSLLKCLLSPDTKNLKLFHIFITPTEQFFSYILLSEHPGIYILITECGEACRNPLDFNLDFSGNFAFYFSKLKL
jgi:hypothetical protein